MGLAAYGAAGVAVGWFVLVVLFFRMYAPEKSIAQVIRDVESSR